MVLGREVSQSSFRWTGPTAGGGRGGEADGAEQESKMMTKKTDAPPKWRLSEHFLQAGAVMWRVSINAVYVSTPSHHKESLVRPASLSLHVTVSSNKHLTRES